MPELGEIGVEIERNVVTGSASIIYSQGVQTFINYADHPYNNNSGTKTDYTPKTTPSNMYSKYKMVPMVK